MAERRTLTHLDRTLRLVAPHELIEVASAQACALGDGAQHRVLQASPGSSTCERAEDGAALGQPIQKAAADGQFHEEWVLT